MNESGTLWDSYKTSEQRAGPLPVSSTPKTPKSIRAPETPNVTNIIVGNSEPDENVVVIANPSCSNCGELVAELKKLREQVMKQNNYIKMLSKCQFSSTSEIDSSESHHMNRSTPNGNKKIQRVTPTKRETPTSSSRTSSGAASPAVVQNVTTPSPIVRQILQQLPMSRSSAGTSRLVRSDSNRTSSSSSNSPLVTMTPSRQRLPQLVRTPHSLPMGTYGSRGRTETPIQSTPARRSQSGRRLFAQEPLDFNRNQLPQIENAIEHLAISPIKDSQWAQSCPPRVYLERNRPEFIQRLETRQSIIKAASEKRSEIEQRKKRARSKSQRRVPFQ
uniref:Uncharacterized protein n=1 Tax=Caenorhabditis japonica TaxID=281687 RepID=A0A8R1HIH2_CAEJA